MIHNTSWPYANETGITEKLNCDVLVLGGGLAGCYADVYKRQKQLIWRHISKNCTLINKHNACLLYTSGTLFRTRITSSLFCTVPASTLPSRYAGEKSSSGFFTSTSPAANCSIRSFNLFSSFLFSCFFCQYFF